MFRSDAGGVLRLPMYERLLILEPDAAQANRLGATWVTIANAVGLVLGGGVAVALIAALTS